MQQFYNDKSSTSSPSPLKENHEYNNTLVALNIDEDIDKFIDFIVRKLNAEQINRLKTEEQSA